MYRISNLILKNKKRNKIIESYIKLTDEQIIAKIGMENMPRIALYMYEKYVHNFELVKIKKDDYMLRFGDCFNMANMSYLAITLHFCRIEDGRVVLEGQMSCPTVIGTDISLLISNNGINYKPKLRFHEKRIDGISYERDDFFEISIPLENENKITFFNVVDEKQCRYGKINSQRFVKVSDVFKNQYCYIDGYIFTSQSGVLKIKKSNSEEVYGYEKRFQEEIIKSNLIDGPKFCQLRNTYFKAKRNKKKPIWLFMDRIDKADDNAEVLFEYIQKDKSIDSYFIIDDRSEDYERIKKIGKTIPLYSEEHFLKVLLADYIISSQANGVVENPFWDKCEYVRDLYHNAKIVFLQHGVIKDDMSPTLNRFNTNFYGFVTSSENERQSILNYPYFYNENNVWLTGLPRFDKLFHDEERIILIMPSWRKALMHQEWSNEQNAMIWKINDDYKKSSFYKNYRRLLKNRVLKYICKRYGFKLVFCTHPLLHDIANEIVENTEVECWNNKYTYREMFAKGSLLVTDYSSVAFDFAYLNKPVLYYHFDQKEFYKTHTYKKGYYDYEKNGLGYVCYSLISLIRKIRKYLKQDMINDSIYVDRINQTFKYHDHNTERIYRELLK